MVTPPRPPQPNPDPRRPGGGRPVPGGRPAGPGRPAQQRVPRGAGVSPGRAVDAAPGAGVHPGLSPQRPSGPGYREPAGGRPGGGGRTPLTARHRRRRLALALGLVVLILIGYPTALGVVAWRSLGRIAALPADTASTPGRTYLVVGSDSRQGLTEAERKDLHTGTAAGSRTDSIMLLHVPANGGPTVLVSFPRDSYVKIPGHGSNKINAAFSFGGAKLLAETIEQATGIQIDDYAEIGFGGFAAIVDSIGGVQICPKRDMDDPKAGINLKKGCQQADGPKALGYARARYSDPRGDFGRVERQREVLAAIVTKGTKFGTLINPGRSFGLASAGAGTLTVDEQMGPFALAQFVRGMRTVSSGDGLSLTVPVSGTGTRSGAGSVVLWDEPKAAIVFSALKASDTEVIRDIAQEQQK